MNFFFKNLFLNKKQFKKKLSSVIQKKMTLTLAGSGSGSSCLLSVDQLTHILLIAGGLNWGSIALVGCNPSGSVGSCAANGGDLVTQLVKAVVSDNETACTVDRVIKALVGVSAVYQALAALGYTVPNACLITQQ